GGERVGQDLALAQWPVMQVAPQEPHWMVPVPQPLGIRPQFLPWAVQVVGVQPQTWGAWVGPPPQLSNPLQLPQSMKLVQKPPKHFSLGPQVDWVPSAPVQGVAEPQASEIMPQS